MELATFLGQRIVLDVEGVDLDERLLDGYHGDVDQLHSTIIGGLRAFDGHDVANLDAKTQEVLFGTILVERTVDIDLASLVLQIPVAVGGVGNALHRTLGTVGLAVVSSNNLCTGGQRHLGLLGHLHDVDFLLLTVAGQFQVGRTRLGSLQGLEHDGVLAGFTAGRTDGQPVGHVLKLPVA